MPTHGVVPVASETQHSTNLPVFTEHEPVDLDLDADGLPDQAMLYEGEVYVYLNGRIVEKDESGAPINEDLRRVPDQLTSGGLSDTEHQGLLSEISLEDLKQTDLYVYRVSTGQRIGELRGLSHATITSGAAENSTWFYAMHLATGFNAETRTQIGWQSSALIDDGKHEREYDHLRVGEQLRLIAINRKTGYIGNT